MDDRYIEFLKKKISTVSLLYWIKAFLNVFILIPSDYQPILGFVCPLIRDILLKILNFITYRVGGGRCTKMGKCFIHT